MSIPFKITLYLTFSLLWLTGCVWLALHFFFQPVTEFGVMPHPLEPRLLRWHGMIAVLGVFLLGWITSSHILPRWQQRRRPPSGVLTTVIAVLLVVTGYTLYYSTSAIHEMSSALHEAIGAIGIVIAVIHWRSRPRRAATFPL